MYLLVSFLSIIYPFSAMHSLGVTIIRCKGPTTSIKTGRNLGPTTSIKTGRNLGPTRSIKTGWNLGPATSIKTGSQMVKHIIRYSAHNGEIASKKAPKLGFKWSKTQSSIRVKTVKEQIKQKWLDIGKKGGGGHQHQRCTIYLAFFSISLFFVYFQFYYRCTVEGL